MLDDVAHDMCALTWEAWNLPEVKDTAIHLSYEHQALARGMLAIATAEAYIVERERSEREGGH